MLNWAGNIEYGASAFTEPSSVSELQDLVATAPRVKALGSRHSFSNVADTDGLAVGVRRLGLEPELDEETGIVAVPAGATYAEIGGYLQARGRALHNLGSLPHISVGGACATGTHGSGVTHACLASAVTAVELVRADGELVHIGQGDPDLGGAALSLGALGVTTRLWLRTEPTYDVAQRVVLDLPAAAVEEHAVEVLSAASSVSLFSTFADPDVFTELWLKQRLDAGPGLDPMTWGGRAATEAVHPIPGIDPAATTTQLGEPGAWIDRWPHFRMDHVPSVGVELQTEVMVPLERAGDALVLLRSLAHLLAPVLQTFELRAVAADDLWLSPFRDRTSATVHFTWVAHLDRVLPVLIEVEDGLEALGGRAHWGKVVSSGSRWRVEAGDPYVARFRDLVGRLDPEGCFTNAFLVDRGVLDRRTSVE